MAPNPRVRDAFRAMKSLGISEDKVKPVLKNLLKVYEKNWELIEEENYRVLADAIFENEEAKATEFSKKPMEEDEKAEVNKEPERPLKRLRRRYQESEASNSVDKPKANVAGTSLIKPKEEPNELPEPCPQTQNPSQDAAELTQPRVATPSVESPPVSFQPLSRNKGKEPVSPKSSTLQENSDLPQPGNASGSQPTHQRRNNSNLISHPMRLRDRAKHTLNLPNDSGDNTSGPLGSSQAVSLNEPQDDHGILLLPNEKMSGSHALMKPKHEPFTDELPEHGIPAAVICPESPNNDSLHGNDSAREQDNPGTSVSQAILTQLRSDGVQPLSNETRSNFKLVNGSEESLSNLEIASTPCGKVKIALSYDLAHERPDFHIPNLQTVLEMVKDKYIRTYSIVDSNFSVMKVMKDMCDYFLKLGNGCSSQLQEILNVTLAHDMPDRSLSKEALLAKTVSSNSSNGLLDIDAEAALPEKVPLQSPSKGTDDCAQPAKDVPPEKIDEENEQEKDDIEQTNSQSLIERECQPTLEVTCSPINVFDLAKGQERVIISLVNEVNNECPPSFHYIPHNAVFQNAYVSLSLARIGDNNCCSTCSGDCLSLSIPCACANEMGGDFVYTKEGLVKEDFLKECISMNRDPEKHCKVYCEECPLERSKNDNTIESCKGHLVRRFIKECWWKCGCNKQCGNRVVQRGISRRLQVYMTPEGKGWGLRTLEDLPKGTFVCEYVGEVLTNAELFKRIEGRKGQKHSYPVMLDADWASEAGLKDEEALCLDATEYGNVARFINHRCYDSNMVEIPVEFDTPDHHYYHLAFFTTKKVKAMEELTWDYGIDFDDIDHPVKAFQCNCGSKYCRNIKRSRRTRAASRR